jgi:general secretion pathway protein A
VLCGPIKIMYLKYYGIKKQPFHITPDPEFLYLSPSHREALAAIIYGIEQRKGFIAIIGAVGVGKTTILRSYLETSEKKHLKIIYIFNTRLTFEELLKTIYHELGLHIETDDVLMMINKLYEILIEEYKQGNTVVLIIDEAQNMPVDTLENLRMLSNLETSKDKLIQIVLVGQPEFEDKINLNRLRQLRQRLAIRSIILPLTKNESMEYIRFRLQKAGSNAASVFTTEALKKIIKKANGIPRVLNILCDNALITGFGYRQKPVSNKITREIIRDFEGLEQRSSDRWWLFAVPVVALLLLGVTMWFVLYNETYTVKAPVIMPHEEKKPDNPFKEIKPTEKPAAQDNQMEPAPAKNEVAPVIGKSEPGVTIKTVVPGDTLSKLAQKVYGNTDNKVMKTIQQNNPQITDPNLIHAGSTIIFPDSPKQEKSGGH